MDIIWGPELSWMNKPANKNSVIRNTMIGSECVGYVPTRWGHYVDHLRLPDKVIKTLTILHGNKISNQHHLMRNEVWHILSGTGQAVLQDGDSVIFITLEPGVKFTVREKVWHQVKADDDSTLVALEIQEGESCVEDDIIRKDDVL